MPILLLFFFSGVTALIYEVIWSDYLTLIFGSTIQAQTVVLAVFMGGLALGNKLFGKFADRARRPLVIYGGIEIAIGLYAFFFFVPLQTRRRHFRPGGFGAVEPSRLAAVPERAVERAAAARPDDFDGRHAAGAGGVVAEKRGRFAGARRGFIPSTRWARSAARGWRGFCSWNGWGCAGRRKSPPWSICWWVLLPSVWAAGSRQRLHS